MARDPILLLPLFKEGGLGQIDLNELDVRELANKGHAAEYSIDAGCFCCYNGLNRANCISTFSTAEMFLK